MKKLKICFAASTGGHFEQLMMLKPLMKKYDSFILTEKTICSKIHPMICSVKVSHYFERSYP